MKPISSSQSSLVGFNLPVSSRSAGKNEETGAEVADSVVLNPIVLYNSELNPVTAKSTEHLRSPENQPVEAEPVNEPVKKEEARPVLQRKAPVSEEVEKKAPSRNPSSLMLNDDGTFAESETVKPEFDFSSLTLDAIKITPEDAARQLELLFDLAEEAHQVYAGKLDDAKSQMEEIFGEFGQIQGRAKNPKSAANRLKRAIEAKDWGPDRISTVEEAIDNLWDAIGTRIVLSDTSSEGVQKFVDSFAGAIQSGKLEVNSLNNLRGVNGKAYFSPEQIQQIRQADFERRQELKAQGKDPGKPMVIGDAERTAGSPFTSVCAYVQHEGGVRGELQIIGPKALEIADAEHLPYDAMIGKDLYRELTPEKAAQIKPRMKPFEDAIAGMTKEQQDKYGQYLNCCYVSARYEEMGYVEPTPVLPPGINPALSMDNIIKLHKLIAGH